jgi:hypothetical protein
VGNVDGNSQRSDDERSALFDSVGVTVLHWDCDGDDILDALFNVNVDRDHDGVKV